jgi:hypothetical protein
MTTVSASLRTCHFPRTGQTLRGVQEPRGSTPPTKRKTPQIYEPVQARVEH